MAIQIGLSALLGMMFAALLSFIQLGELNVWSLAFGYQLGALMPIFSALTAYRQESDA